jgi:opacity protein-like surface antigen
VTRRLALFLIGSIVSGTAAGVVAQDMTPAVFGDLGVANVYRAEDRSFGTELNVGGGLGLEWRRFGLDVDAHRTRLTPSPFQCGVVGVPCVGEAREGFEKATMLSGNVRYFFWGSRVRPYVMGSVGVLWTEGVNSLTLVTDTVATLSEVRERDTGLALGVGFGVDVPVTARFSVSPEFRTYSATAMSRVNLGVHRGTIGLRYRFGSR